MIELEWKFPNLAEKLKRHMKEIHLGVAAAMQENRAELFYSEGKHNGRAGWRPLKFRDGMILQNRGNLRKSMTGNSKGSAGGDGIVRYMGDKVTIGSTLFYARLMNDGTTKMPGGVLRATRAKALKIPVNFQVVADIKNKKNKKMTNAAQIKKKMGKTGSGNYIFRKSVKIPARRFDDWNNKDQSEMEMTLKNLIVMVLNGKA